MSQRNEERTDIDRLRARARALFISQATIDDLLAWATPRQLQAVDRLLRTELDNRETSKRARLLRRARFPVPKTLDGYDFTNVKLPDGYARDELLSLDFVGRAQDLVFYGKTGRGKTHLATALGMSAIDRGMNVRFLPTAELVLQLGRAKREGTLETMLKDIAKADLIIPARVRLRALRRRRRQTALPGHRRQLREKEHHLHHEHRVHANGARSSPTTNSPPRSSTASFITDDSSSSPDKATASARHSCSANPKTNKTHPAGTPTPKTEKNTRRKPKHQLD